MRSARECAVGVDGLMLVMQAETLPHELVMRSIRTFAEKVIPHFDTAVTSDTEVAPLASGT